MKTILICFVCIIFFKNCIKNTATHTEHPAICCRVIVHLARGYNDDEIEVKYRMLCFIIMTERQKNIIRKIHYNNNNNMIAYYRAGLRTYTRAIRMTRVPYTYRFDSNYFFFTTLYNIIIIILSGYSAAANALAYLLYVCTHAHTPRPASDNGPLWFNDGNITIYLPI